MGKGFRLSAKEKHFLFYFTVIFLSIFGLLKIAEPQPVNLFVAQLQEQILSAAGYNAVRDGTTLLLNGAAFQIVIDCSGLVMMTLFFALLYSTKTRISTPRLLAYFAFFFLFNLLRLAFTIGIAADYGEGALGIVHPVLWFVDAGVVFVCWAKEYGLLPNKR